jgi:hypothetical protein
MTSTETPVRLTPAQARFLDDAADSDYEAGTKIVYGREKRTREILEAAGLIEAGSRPYLVRLTDAGYAAIGRPTPIPYRHEHAADTCCGHRPDEACNACCDCHADPLDLVPTDLDQQHGPGHDAPCCQQ